MGLATIEQALLQQAGRVRTSRAGFGRPAAEAKSLGSHLGSRASASPKNARRAIELFRRRSASSASSVFSA
jgi:hypothetical protein